MRNGVEEWVDARQKHVTRVGCKEFSYYDILIFMFCPLTNYGKPGMGKAQVHCSIALLHKNKMGVGLEKKVMKFTQNYTLRVAK